MTTSIQAVLPARGTPRGFAGRFLRKPLSVAATVVLLVIVAACLLSPWLAPYPPLQSDYSAILQGPSASHWLGTDRLGRDILSRLLHGGVPSLWYAFVVAVVAFVTAVPIGLFAGFRGGWADRIIGGVVEIGLAMPVIIMIIVVLAVFDDWFMVAVAVMGVLMAPPIVRTVRGAVIAVRQEQYVDAARVAGLTLGQIISRHILPRVAGPILVQAVLTAAIAVQFTVGLAYLGFGVTAPDPTWGSMVTEGAQVLGSSAWLLISAGGVIIVVTLCLGLIGDGIRDVFVEAWTGAPPRRVRRAAARPEPVAPARDEHIPEAETDVLLEVSDLSIAFEQDGHEILAVSNVSFAIDAGEAVALVGESGCGKTSVARSVLRLLSGGAHIAGGRILFEGRDILEMSRAELTKYRGGIVGYVAQNPFSSLDPTTRIGTQLRVAIRAHRTMTRREADERVLELLELVRLPDPAAVARKYPHELSGGMAQRVAIARAISARPRLLIADEPTTALDVTVQAEILALLGSLRAELGMALVLVSHDWGVVSQVCDRGIVMYAGQAVESGPMAELINEPAHPYTRALLDCRPDRATTHESRLASIPGTVMAPGTWPHGCRFAARCPIRVAQCEEAPVPLIAVSAGHESRCLFADAVHRDAVSVDTLRLSARQSPAVRMEDADVR